MSHTNIIAAPMESASPADDYFFTEKDRKIYNKWRIRILVSIIVGYATFYLCRLNFSMIMPAFMEEFGYTKTQLGGVLSIASIIYGIGKFVNGYLSDRSNARYFMPLGLFLSAIVTFFLGFSESIIYLGIFWVINNWLQSMGWPPVARMLTHWFAPKELGTKWALGAASHYLGGGITLVFTGYLVADFGWRSAFFVPSFVALLVAFGLYHRLRESPKAVGLRAVEFYKAHGVAEKTEEEDNLTTMEIVRKVFMSRNMWYMCFANICIYTVKTGVVFWGPLFLKEFKDVNITQAGWQLAAYDTIGVVGGLAAGWVSDKVFHGKRGPVGAMFMAVLAFALLIFWQTPADYGFFNGLMLVFVGFFVSGPQVLVGVASADFTSKKAVGTANGLAGTMGYVGAGIAGVGVGSISDMWGWSAVFMFFIVVSILGSFFFYLTQKKSNL